MRMNEREWRAQVTALFEAFELLRDKSEVRFVFDGWCAAAQRKKKRPRKTYFLTAF